MDSLQYNYKSSITNQLDFVKDAVAGDPFTEDIEHQQASGNYDYDEIGNLIADDDEGGMTMAWEAGGRVKSVNHAIAGGNGQQIEYTYDAGGSRIKKTVTTATVSELTTETTYYVRDAIGTVVAIYEESCTEALQPDMDLDGVPDHLDNCPTLFNPFQENFDGATGGNRCDTDDDNDGSNDAFDPCPFDPTNSCPPTDPDSDGIPNGIDNCPTVFNPIQSDGDGDGIGDACDNDLDNDLLDNDHDPCPFDAGDECGCEIELVELPIYGSGRIGVAHPDISIDDPVLSTDVYTREIGEKSYELTDHLGNVRAVISDRKRVHSPGTGGYFAEFTAYTNQYPYGMPQPGRSWDAGVDRYRYGFNGMESDPEVKLEDGHHMTTFFRQYDPRVARWWSNDPVTHEWQSPYMAMDANPVRIMDATGADGEPQEDLDNPLDPRPSGERPEDAEKRIKDYAKPAPEWKEYSASVSWEAAGDFLGGSHTTDWRAFQGVYEYGYLAYNGTLPVTDGSYKPFVLQTENFNFHAAYDKDSDGNEFVSYYTVTFNAHDPWMQPVDYPAWIIGASDLPNFLDNQRYFADMATWALMELDRGARYDYWNGNIGEFEYLTSMWGSAWSSPSVWFNSVTGTGLSLALIRTPVFALDDIISNPLILEGRALSEVQNSILSTAGWEIGQMRHSTRASGWVLRQVNSRGTDYTGLMIQYHPGTPRHYGGAPYWKVSSGTGRTVRIPAGQ